MCASIYAFLLQILGFGKKSLNLEHNVAKHISEHLNSSLIEPMISADAGKRHAFEDGSPKA